jgi:mono/diheme cytochrome c family protein
VVRITFAVLVSIGLIALAVPAAAPRGSAKVVGNPARGKVLFRTYCSSCHTLKAAGATGRFGPNLDKLEPSYARVVTQVTTGGTAVRRLPPSMLTFGPGTFTASDIRDIAAFVFISTHKREAASQPS